MSEELRDILGRQTLMNRLRVVNNRETLIAPASIANPSFQTIVLRYVESGIFAPHALLTGAWDANFLAINPGPTTFTYVVKNMQGKIIQNGRELWNSAPTGAVNNLTSYIDNFDMGVCLYATDWVYLDITSFANFSYSIQPYMIGVEFLP